MVTTGDPAFGESPQISSCFVPKNSSNQASLLVSAAVGWVEWAPPLQWSPPSREVAPSRESAVVMCQWAVRLGALAMNIMNAVKCLMSSRSYVNAFFLRNPGRYVLHIDIEYICRFSHNCLDIMIFCSIRKNLRCSTSADSLLGDQLHPVPIGVNRPEALQGCVHHLAVSGWAQTLWGVYLPWGWWAMWVCVCVCIIYIYIQLVDWFMDVDATSGSLWL